MTTSSSLLLNVTDATKSSCLRWPDVTFKTGAATTFYVVNAVFNSLLAVLATLSNILVFLAIRKSTSLHLPSKLLLASLVVADLGVGLIGQPLYVAFLTAKVKNLFGVACFSVNVAAVLGAALAGASLFTMTLMSIDRFIAFHFSLKYRQIVTVRRVGFTLGSCWLFSVFAASMWLWNPEHFYISIPLGVVLCTLVTSLAYISVYRGLRVNRVETEAANRTQSRARDFSNYRKAASAMFWVYFIFLLCYIPLVCCVLAIRISGIDLLKRQVFEISQTILLLNSSVNPYVYCWRIPDIREGVLNTIRGICSH